MKSAITIWTLIILSGTSYGQSSWGNWITVYSEGAKSIQISFKYSKWGNTCYPKGGGYHFYRLKNDFDEKVGGTILYDNLDCDGKSYTNNAPFHFEGQEIDEDRGMWFLGQSGVTNIHLKRAPDFYDRKKKATTNNNSESPGLSKNTDHSSENPDKESSNAGSSSESNPGTTTKEEVNDQAFASKGSTASSTNAQIEEERRKARQKYIQDSTDATWKERNNRVENHKKEQQEKEAIASGMATAATALMLTDADNSKISGRRTYFKLGGFIGMTNIPAYENMTSPEVQYMNFTSARSHLPIMGEVELEATLYKGELFSLQVNPFVQYGMSFMGGDNGTYTGYGGRGMITFGKKIKLYATGAYEAKMGENTYDNDAAMESAGLITNTKAIGTLAYDYSVISYGGGLLFDTNSGSSMDQEDKFIQLGVIVHQPSITAGKNFESQVPQKMILGGQFKWVLGGGFTLGADYVPNYPIAGETIFKPTSNDKQDYWSVKIGKTFNLSSSR